MKKLLVLFTFLFLVSSAFAYEQWKMIGGLLYVQNESATIMNRRYTQTAPAIGLYTTSSFFEEEQLFGFTIADSLKAYIVPDSFYMGTDLSLQLGFRPSLETLPMIISGGLLLSAEMGINDSLLASQFLIGFGLDYLLGTSKSSNCFGITLYLHCYPFIKVFDTVKNQYGREITEDVSQYLTDFFRVSFGVSFGGFSR